LIILIPKINENLHSSQSLFDVVIRFSIFFYISKRFLERSILSAQMWTLRSYWQQQQQLVLCHRVCRASSYSDLAKSGIASFCDPHVEIITCILYHNYYVGGESLTESVRVSRCRP